MFIERQSQGTIVLTGSDRRAFLHALLTNDIARLTAGTGAYAAYLTPQGRMIADMRVIETGDDIVLGVESSIAGALAARFDSLVFSEDVQTRDASEEFAVITVLGDDAFSSVEAALGIPARRLASMKPLDNVRPPSARLTIVSDRTLAVPQVDLYVPREDTAKLLRSLESAGVRSGSEEDYESLRIAAAVARFGVDMDTDTIPLEAGIEDRAISMTKGCYVGQEVIVRVLHRGHGRVAKRLVGLDIDGEILPQRGDQILVGAEAAGRITSAAHAASGRSVALGYLDREHAIVGGDVRVDRAGAALHARVRQLAQ